jgi:hypothetical protein
MTLPISDLGIGIAAFTSTNIDDAFLLGLTQLLALRGSTFGGEGVTERDRAEYQKLNARGTSRSQVVVVAASTYVLTFAVMTGVWCCLSYWLVNKPVLGGSIRRYGRVVLPIVLIALGVYILSDAVVLIR